MDRSYYHLAVVFSLLGFFSSVSWGQLSRRQEAQNEWVAPTYPDNSTSIQAGNPFTLRWTNKLQNYTNFCSPCSPKKLDLWVTSFTNDKHWFKVAAGIDITTTYSYQWDVNIPSSALQDTNLWVFRFLAFNAEGPTDAQLSSSGFFVSAAGNTPSATASQTSSTSAPPTSISTSFSSIASQTTSTSPISTNPSSTPAAAESSKPKTWIAGVVIGPLAGIAIGAAVMWFLLAKRRRRGTHDHPKELPHSSYSDGAGMYVGPGATPEKHPEIGVGGQWRYEMPEHENVIVEAPQSLPAELVGSEADRRRAV